MDKNSVLKKIENFYINALKQISLGEFPIIQYKCVKEYDEESEQFIYNNNPKIIDLVNIPKVISLKKNPKKFNQIIQVLSFLYVCIKDDIVVTKRDIFYSHIQSFSNQTESDGIIKTISFALEIPRFNLNIIASEKGLVEGNLAFKFRGSLINAKNIISITAFIDDLSDFEGNFDFVLVVEKSSVFQRLSSLGFPSNQKCLLVTGVKNLIRNKFTNVPFFCLVDADPFGVLIYCIYAFGSANSYDEPDLIIPNLKWIGLNIFDIISDKHFPVLKMEGRELGVLNRLLSEPFILQYNEIHQQLLEMKSKNCKAEVEVLSAISISYIEDYIIKQTNRYFMKESDRLKEEGLLNTITKT